MKRIIHIAVYVSILLMSCKALQNADNNYFTIKILLDLNYSSNCYYNYESKNNTLKMMCYSRDRDTCTTTLESLDPNLFKEVYEKTKKIKIKDHWILNDTRANNTKIWIKDNNSFEKKIIINDFPNFKSLEVVLSEMPILYEKLAEDYGCFKKEKKIEIETVKEYYKIYLFDDWSLVKEKGNVLLEERDWHTLEILMGNYILLQGFPDYQKEYIEPEIMEQLTSYLTEEALVYFKLISKEIRTTRTDEQIQKRVDQSMSW